MAGSQPHPPHQVVTNLYFVVAPCRGALEARYFRPWLDDRATLLGSGERSIYSIGSDPRAFPRGKAASISRISAALRATASDPPFSKAWLARAAFGIASTALSRRRNARAAWCDVMPRLLAIALRALPRGELSGGKLPEPKGLYATSATPWVWHHGSTACSIARSSR